MEHDDMAQDSFESAVQVQRRRRIRVEIPVILTTVLESIDGTIVDLTEAGALITGATLAAGTRFQIEYMGQTLYAQCRWAEIDRIGVAFAFPLTDGPLHERLTMARAAQLPDDAGTGLHVAYAPIDPRAPTMIGRGFGRAAAGGFGRRAG
jgi:hypothetical protein